jgi:choline kinase
MRAIVIGAGRGQRLRGNTDDQPKCFVEVNGTRILDWTLDAFRKNGIEDICFIGGYRIECVRRDYPEFTLLHNDDWPNNNILESLMYAQDLMGEPFICCYSDTLITPNLVSGLLENPADIVLSIDTDWLSRYEFRSEHPVDDAEKVIVANGRVQQVHRGIDEQDAYGEFTGVAKFTHAGAKQLKAIYADRKSRFSGQAYREAKVFEKAYFIHLLQDMIEDGVKMAHADTAGEYMEIDTEQDFDLARKHWDLENNRGQ